MVGSLRINITSSYPRSPGQAHPRLLVCPLPRPEQLPKLSQPLDTATKAVMCIISSILNHRD